MGAQVAEGLVDEFAGALPFPLDPFQRHANEALARGHSVLVCAPTGAGKTVVGEFGVHLALQRRLKTFYTTPLKALSNQKFGDFIARHGAARVGLLTGDNSINGEAPVVVMTTEVLRNMLYERSPTLEGLGMVVLDEVHFLQDRYRGATWEEVMIHLAPDVQIAALSATVSNAEEFGEWMRSVRGPTDVIVERKRPVPIEHSYMIGRTLHPMFVRQGQRLVPNPALRREQDPPRDRHAERRRKGGRPRAHGRRNSYRPDRVEVIERLRDEEMLPAITFIFSRAGCDRAVEQCRFARLRLTDDDERERIREYAEMRAGVLSPQDLEVLGFDTWLEALEMGYATHHAGMIPLFKETVEELFERALVKAVFATETLALGINMPAKTVVLERLVKFTGERHEMLTPGEFTQLTGRAGRRGMDEVGFGIVLLQKDIGFDRIAGLAEGQSFPLASSFRPSYNMAVNLLRVHPVEEATRLLNLSFAQFQIDRSVVRQQQSIERNVSFITSYRERARCDLGDVESYWALARDARAAERKRAEEMKRSRGEMIRSAFQGLRRGDVVQVPRGPRAGLAAVLDVRTSKTGQPQPLVLTEDRRLGRLLARDFRDPPSVIGTIELPRGNPRSGAFKHEVSQRLETMPSEAPPARAVKPDRGEARARSVFEDHPVFACPDRVEHERWMERADSLEKETGALRKRVERRTGSLARTFQAVLRVLTAFGYIERDATVTGSGERLSRIYNESDLLLAEAIARGVLDGLDAAELAAVASLLVYETRMGVPDTTMPSARTADAYRQLQRLWRRVVAAETDEGLELVREPDPGFARAIHHWASGADLDDVLELGEWSPGDFVRSAKQVWDLVRQIQDLEVTPDLTSQCKEAARAVYRGVVAASGAL